MYIGKGKACGVLCGHAEFFLALRGKIPSWKRGFFGGDHVFLSRFPLFYDELSEYLSEILTFDIEYLALCIRILTPGACCLFHRNARPAADEPVHIRERDVHYACQSAAGCVFLTAQLRVKSK